MPALAIVTCRDIPEPDKDEPVLMGALGGAGIDADLVAWDDPGVDWSGYDLAVIRSTWNYISDLAGFTEWAASVPRLLNPSGVVLWNSHKTYLGELAVRNLPVVPTEFFGAGDPRSLADVMAETGWDDVVAKPTIGAGSFLTDRVRGHDLPGAEDFWRRLVGSREAMVQPYLASVEAYGERCLVWVDGEFTHAIRKNPRLGDDAESVSDEALLMAEDELDLAGRALDLVHEELLYARVDLIRDETGAPVVAELELVEPQLFLRHSLYALQRLVAGIQRHLG